MTASQNVLIFSSSTGGGHLSAANALADSFHKLLPGQVLVRISQVLEEGSFVSRKMSDVYNYLLRERQHWMKYYYWLIHHLKPNESKWVFDKVLPYGARVVERFCPDAVVSVHPMTQHFCAYLLRKLKLIDKVPLVTVVTDPCSGFWKGWACDDVHRYYVAGEEARRQLEAYGVPPERIRVSGMPVHQKFKPVNADEKRALKLAAGLDPEKFTVFLNAGWIGGGNVPKMLESLAFSEELAAQGIQMIYLTGKNRDLYEKGRVVSANAHMPVHVMGYTDEMPQLMNMSDVLVSKLGGLTTFEAIASHLPILGDAITPPMPQEAQTARFIESSKAGLLLRDPLEIVSVVESLVRFPERCESMRQAAARHGSAGGSEAIAQDVLAYLKG